MMLNDQRTLEAALQLGLAFLLALPLGWEREQRSRSAGLRTYPLLAVGVCSFLLVPQRVAGGPGEQANVFFGVLSGIAFMASGAIVKSPQHAGGVSTAVSVWVTGAIGAGVAYGAPLTSAALSLASAFTLWAPSLVRRREGTS
jgi:putative Mg2+ transporter-C (MgtC) family protein